MSTTYRTVFIEVAPDCPVTGAEVPPVAARPSIAALQHRLLTERPYELTSDDLLFALHVERSDLPEGVDLVAERDAFFAKDRACLRASPLSKRYGWGTHHDDEGRVALVGLGTPEYDALRSDPTVRHLVAMRSSRA